MSQTNEEIVDINIKEQFVECDDKYRPFDETKTVAKETENVASDTKNKEPSDHGAEK